MPGWWRILENTSRANGGDPVETVLLCLLLAFVLGQVIAWTYAGTHSGLSYSRVFTQSLVLLTMIVTLVMLVIGNNIVTAFGLLGALAIIRFRNVLKDTRDTAYVFLALVVGMAIGSQKILTAVVGTAGFVLVALYLDRVAFGSLARFDGHLSLVVQSDPEAASSFRSVLERFCRSSRRLVAQPSAGGDEIEYVLEVRLRDRKRGGELVEELRKAPGVRQAVLTLREDLYET